MYVCMYVYYLNVIHLVKKNLPFLLSSYGHTRARTCQVMDADRSGSLSAEEFGAALRKLVRSTAAASACSLAFNVRPGGRSPLSHSIARQQHGRVATSRSRMVKNDTGQKRRMVKNDILQASTVATSRLGRRLGQ